MSEEPVQIGRKSSAATTTFCAIPVTIGDIVLYVDGNQKITAGNGSYEDPKPNAFSLPAQAVENPDGRDHCPGSTAVCRASCYVGGLAKHAAQTYDLYKHNAEAVRAASAVDFGWFEHAVAFGEWIAENCKGGFRWHVSGDIFSEDYAGWISVVVDTSYKVKHWIYTRSFDLMEPLVGIPNLALNLSCDSENYQEAVYASRFRHYAGGIDEHGKRFITHGWDPRPEPLRLCYLTDDGTVPDDLPEGSVIFPDYKFRGGEGPWFTGLTAEHKAMVCPVDVFSKSEHIRCGVCRKCM